VFLARRIERGSRFIHYENVRALDEDARKIEARLFAGEHLLPPRILVEAFHEMGETDFSSVLRNKSSSTSSKPLDVAAITASRTGPRTGRGQATYEILRDQTYWRRQE
jgi:hypothetical protein